MQESTWADRTTDDCVIGNSQVNAPLKTSKTFKILLKSAVRMHEMSFQRHKFQTFSEEHAPGPPKNADPVGPPMASAPQRGVP